ncbi:MAG TPA: cytochrome c [Spongiibacteraceae bacterium]|nr:cytochrome c [Spongiibacteraceae bacterium]
MIRSILIAIVGINCSSVFAAEGAKILESQCEGCHAIEKPGKTDLSHIWERKGPDLYYAGNKFQRDWLVAWLQAPTRIRPGGEFYRKHIKSSPDGDVIDSSTLSEHVRLDKSAAESAADALMALTVSGLVESGSFKNGEVSPTIGAMFFRKLRGCAACHQDTTTNGGLSGPELYSAATRLQADYVYSYIKHPQTIDPHVWMPDLGLGEADLQRLTGYIMQPKGAEAK